jgi:molybdopterin synthase sulfur carrier subunit
VENDYLIIRTKFFGPIRDLIKKSRLVMEVPQNISLLNFVHIISKRCEPKLLDKILTKNGSLQSNVKILVNGRNIVHINQLETELKNNDVVAFFHITGGG